MALVCEAIVGAMRGNPEAHTVGEKGVRTLLQLGDTWHAALAQQQLAWVAVCQGSDRQAELIEASLVSYREVGDSVGVAIELNDLAGVARWQGDYERAAVLYDQSTALFRELGLRPDLARALHGLGMVAYHQGQVERARALLSESFRLFREANHIDGIGWCFEGFAGIAAHEGQPLRAVRLLAADATINDPIHSHGLPAQAEWQRIAASARAQLDEAAWEAAWAEGQALTLEQAIAYALSDET